MYFNLKEHLFYINLDTCRKCGLQVPSVTKFTKTLQKMIKKDKEISWVLFHYAKRSKDGENQKNYVETKNPARHLNKYNLKSTKL